MPINPRHQISASYIDEGEEPSGFTANVGPITVGTLAGFLTQMDTFLDTVQALSLGALTQTSWTGDITDFTGAAPTDPNAQRERKWRVDYEDAVTFASYQLEIPIAKVNATLKVAHSEKADFTAAEWIAFIAAAEALLKSPEGNAINVLSAKLVGRNL